MYIPFVTVIVNTPGGISYSILPHNFREVDTPEYLIQFMNLSSVISIHYLFKSILLNYFTSDSQAIPVDSIL